MYSSTYYSRNSNTIHCWEYNENGEKVYIKDSAPLYFYIPTDEESEYKSIFGNNVKRKTFETYGKMREAKEMYKAAGRNLYESDIDVENRYLLDKWSGVDFEKPKFDIHFLDIEVHSEKGFPKAEDAAWPITVITVYSTKYQRYFVFAEKEFDRNYVDEDGNQVLSDKDWVKCFDTEEELIETFIGFVKKTHPDVISGWNSNLFDIPYIINRGYKLLGEKKTNQLSPIGFIKSVTKKLRFGREQEVYEIAGINLIDYIDLYKKYRPVEQSSYKLDYIAKVEIDEKKLAYTGSIKELYNNNWQRYVEYNIQDVGLLVRLDQKLGFMDMMFGICYNCRVPFEQFQKTVRVLDGAFISRLMLDKIIVPDSDPSEDSEYDGAFVKDPRVGCWDWIISYDATSLYPSIMMQHNISPETKVYKCNRKATEIIKLILSGEEVETWEKNVEATDDGMTVSDMVTEIKDNNYSIASNGAVYRHDKPGIISRFVKEWFDNRQTHKKLQFKCHEEGDVDGERLNKMLQQNYKILINSVYGYVGTIYSRFYDKDNALAVTATGQEVIKTAMDSVDDFFREKWAESGPGTKVGAKPIPNTVVYGDTDSLYTHAGAVLESFGYKDFDDTQKAAKFLDEKISPIFVKVIDAAEKKLALKAMNCPECMIVFKREMVARRGIFIAKKRYVAWVIIGEDGPVHPGSDHEIEVKGLEAVRSSTPEKTREKLIEFYKVLLQTQDKKKTNDYVKAIYTEMVSSEANDIAKNSSANNIAKWTGLDGEPIKGTPFHIKGCIGYNALLKRAGIENDYESIYEGDKVKVVYIKNCQSFMDYAHDVISWKGTLPKEFGVIIDVDKMAQKVWVEPLKVFYSILNWQLPSFDTEDIEDMFG
jgi:DNA polymerase elongation subunit (family B)